MRSTFIDKLIPYLLFFRVPKDTILRKLKKPDYVLIYCLTFTCLACRNTCRSNGVIAYLICKCAKNVLNITTGAV